LGRFTGLLGLAVIPGIARVFSSKRRASQHRVLFWGLGLLDESAA
jgi:hypothetical protein